MTAAATGSKPWNHNSFQTKQVTVHINRIQCEPGQSGTGIERRFRLHSTVDSGRSKGFTIDVCMSALEAEATFKDWHDLTQMKTGDEYTFDVDDQPYATVVYRNNNPHHYSDVQIDTGRRAKIIQAMMDEANLHPDHHIYKNRKLNELRDKVREFPTTAKAREWAYEYIKEFIDVTNQPTEPTAELDELKDAGEKLTSALDETFPRPKREHSTTDPEQMVHAVPNFLERELNLNKDTKEKNKVAFQIYGVALTAEYITEQTPAAIWIKAEDYVDQYQIVYDAPAEPPTKEQWTAWLTENGLTREYVVELMNTDSIARGEGPVKGLTQWDKDIPAAMGLVEVDRSLKAATLNEKATTSPETKSQPPQPATQSKPIAPTSTNGNGQSKDNPKSGLKIEKAIKRNLKLRLALAGVPGAGKTYTALQIATSMFPNGKIAVIDTENRNSLKYADLFNFDYIDIGAPYSPERYIEGIKLVEEAGYDILIIDSLSHGWKEEGGILSWVDQAKGNPKYQTQSGKENTQAIWAEATPRHNAMVSAVLNSKIHIIATLRAKYREVPIRDNNKQIVGTRKIITDFVQRDGLPYEFDIIAKLQDPDVARVDIDKTRCPKLVKFSKERAGVEIANILVDWLKDDPAALAAAS
jgi:hypothetical protein